MKIKNPSLIFVILIILLSVTGWFAGFLIGRTNVDINYTGMLIDTIVITSGQYGPGGKDAGGQVPVYAGIELRGRILYTDGSPYSNGTVELRSDPVYSTTDNEGYFVFSDILPGEHTISVLEEGKPVTSSSLVLERDIDLSGAMLTRYGDNNYVINVAVNVMLIEISMEIREGYISINPSIRAVSKDPDKDSAAGIPGIYINEGVDSSFKWTQVSSIDIFGRGNGAVTASPAVISPGAEGRYVFNIQNPEASKIVFSMRLSESDENVPALPMEYRISGSGRGDNVADGGSITGGAYYGGESWKRAQDVEADGIILASGERKVFILEWRWAGMNDSIDTMIGTQKGNPRYYLGIVISAEFE